MAPKEFSMPDLVGHSLGQYRLVERIGLGGMATVYKAYQPALDRHVAIKVLPPYYAHEPGFAERFTREAKAVARLTHPHVLPIYDFGQENGLSYIVMQYVQAGTLKELLGQPVNLITAADVIEQIADALDYAHEQGIIHRDVKPSNVLMDRGRWALLSDFGLAKMVEGSQQLTGSGVGVGTPAYMAPEQGQGLKADRRADIYSLGIILYEMVTGRVPFEAETPMAIVVKHITEPLPLPRVLNPNLSEGVERIIMKALAKNPQDRFETAGALASALRKESAKLDTAAHVSVSLSGRVDEVAVTQLADGGATQVVPPVASPLEPRKSFALWMAAAGVAVVVLLLIGGFGLAWRLRSARLSQSASATEMASTQTPAARAPTESSIGAVAPGAATVERPPGEELSPAQPLPNVRAVDPVLERVLAFADQNPPLFEDDFSDPASGWKTSDDQHGRVGYQEGAYLMEVPETGGRNKISVGLPFDHPMADFVLQMDLTAIKGGVGANWTVEFRAREPRDGLYMGLSVQPRGFGIGHISPDGDIPLERGLVRDYRPFQTTHVVLVALGPDIVLCLDGQRVGVTGSELTQPGQLFFNVINTGDPLVAYRLDNLRLWDLEPLVGRSAAPNQDQPRVEDFEDGRADGWRLQPGWEILQEENGNHALLGETHSEAIAEGDQWGDFMLHFRVKPSGNDLAVNLRADPADPGRTRYMAHFMPDMLILHRFHQGERGPVVRDAPIAYTPEQWHQVEIAAQGGHIQIWLDGQSVLGYDDPEPLPPGIVSFENGDPPARNWIDEVLIEPAMPQ
jgi:tRNA A-37 threonylcarbamoyl transferase component Bud32